MKLAAKRNVTLSHLQSEDVIHMARSSSVRQHIEAAGATARTGSIEVEHLATAAALVAQGLGVSIVPEFTHFHFERAGLAIVPIKDKEFCRPLLLVGRKDKALSIAACVMFEEILVEAHS